MEAQIASLERAGVLVDALLPAHSRHVLEDGTERFQVDGAAAMRNGIVLLYIRDFGISIERWREEHRHILPSDPPELGRVRRR